MKKSLVLILTSLSCLLYAGPKGHLVSPDAVAKQPSGAYETINGVEYYTIQNVDAMQPFFLSLASDDDLWLYASSTGTVSAGRQNPDKALFPYETDDRILVNAELTGPKAIIRIPKGKNLLVWEPFSDRQDGAYDITRTFSKSVVGNRLRYAETNHTLGLIYAYEWFATSEYGWIRKASLANIGKKAAHVEVLDGVQNILPAGTDKYNMANTSTLVDAYKRNENVPSTSLMLFTMEATLIDRAEPSESLTANTVYFYGLPAAKYITSARQLQAFRRGQNIAAEPLSLGVRGAAFALFEQDLANGSSISWYQVMDVARNASQVRDIMAVAQAKDTDKKIEAAIAKATQTLIDIVAQSDGIQHSADHAQNARHFANTLYNSMRGGIYCDGYNLSGEAFRDHVMRFNKALALANLDFLTSLPKTLTVQELERAILNPANAVAERQQMLRLMYEYLPITFGRRHGDPSRPWNSFNIRVNDEKGNRIISYQGNWRDIFQNWEALSNSYPAFTNSIIAKFLNATTRDGYNPYRITSEGIDWEVANPADPWSNIGYWGDHQIIYLEKLLELSYAHDAQALYRMMETPVFSFANIPYRLKSYDEIVADPKNTIVFKDTLHQALMAFAGQYGADGKLVMDGAQPLLTSFTDKIFVTLLTKLSNFIPEAGIWMNTLRPEWNDANNALVGNGASMVTLDYMYRMAGFLQTLYKNAPADACVLSNETLQFMNDIKAILTDLNNEPFMNDQLRRIYADRLGRAGEAYRASVYADSKSGQSRVSAESILDFTRTVTLVLGKSIAANKRSDGLYHAYNLVEFTADGKSVVIEHLYPMLEGQVAVLSSFYLSADEALAVLKAMRQSELYREDQACYMLYPNRQLPSFLTKNTFMLSDASQLQSAMDAGLILKDNQGAYHFGGLVNNASALKWLIGKYNAAIVGDQKPITDAQQAMLLDLYEQTFHHHAFTGRSGTMYKYEGLGSIFWHMIGKLQVAIAENIVRAEADKAVSKATVEGLIAAYNEVEAGAGYNKQPQNYGAFPFDAYSHTPIMLGAQQPGMTGHVKEQILSRFMQLGIRVQDGEIHIVPTMLRREEFQDGKLEFTYCGVPFTYILSDHNENTVLDKATSQHIFARDGKVKSVTVHIAK